MTAVRTPDANGPVDEIVTAFGSDKTRLMDIVIAAQRNFGYVRFWSRPEPAASVTPTEVVAAAKDRLLRCSKLNNLMCGTTFRPSEPLFLERMFGI